MCGEVPYGGRERVVRVGVLKRETNGCVSERVVAWTPLEQNVQAWSVRATLGRDFLMRFFSLIFSARRLIHTQLFHPGAVVSHAPSHGSSAVYLGAAAAVTTAFGFQNLTRCETEDVHEGWDVLRLDEVKLAAVTNPSHDSESLTTPFLLAFR
jgi:hypothetical protein